MRLFLPIAMIVTLSLRATAHAIIEPALGVPGNRAATRNDVQMPSNDAPCGTVDIITALPSASQLIARGNGTFVVKLTNFNGGKDGSRQVTAKVDPTAVGQNFTAVTVIENGDLAPTGMGSQAVTVKLPNDTHCTGGPSNDLCLISFKTAAGFGNCVAVQQTSVPESATSSSDAPSTSPCKPAPQSAPPSPAGRRALTTGSRATKIRRARAYRRLFP